jgi:membrane associated rhomboid family serine protease
MNPDASANSELARIQVRSHRQAMDWGLVLESQRIESTIDHSTEGDGWALLVPSRDYARALQALRQYRIENRGWPWQQTLPWPAVRFDWASLLWAVALAVMYWCSQVNPSITRAGLLDGAAFFSGQWWRLFTAMLLHADLGHIATNLSLGVLLVGLVMGRYGPGLGLLAAYCAGALGNLFSVLVHGKQFHGLGASGIIMGALGLLAAQSLTLWKAGRPPLKHVLGGAAAGFMIFVLFGLSPGTDLAAHFGAFISGFVLGAIPALLPFRPIHSVAVNAFASLVLITVVVLSWWLALRHIPN